METRMSTDYCLVPMIPAKAFTPEALAPYGISVSPVSAELRNEFRNPDTTYCVSDGNNRLFVYRHPCGDYDITLGCSRGVLTKITGALCDAFDVKVYSEYDPQYWGCDTQQDFEDALKKLDDEADEEFYRQLLRHLNGEPGVFDPTTNGFRMAEYAEHLVATDPSWLESARRDDLIRELYTYLRDNVCVSVTITSEMIAAAEMLSTHEDDLPHA